MLPKKPRVIINIYIRSKYRDKEEIMVLHALVIVGASIAASLISEVMSWYFIFSKPEYQKLKQQIETNARLLDKWRRAGKDHKKTDRLEAELKADGSKLSAMKAYNVIFLSVAMIAWYQVLKYLYDGQIVGTLPFVPLSLFRKLFQAGLSAESATACSMAGIYAVCSLGLRPNVVRLFGESNPKGMGGGGIFDQLQQGGSK